MCVLVFLRSEDKTVCQQAEKKRNTLLPFIRCLVRGFIEHTKCTSAYLPNLSNTPLGVAQVVGSAWRSVGAAARNQKIEKFSPRGPTPLGFSVLGGQSASPRGANVNTVCQPCATVAATGHGLAPHRMSGASTPMPCQRLFA